MIAAQAVYVFHFWVELIHLLEAAFGDEQALQALVTSIGYKTDAPLTSLNETVIMLVVLALIDVVMISNLLIMVIVGGYETFVSRLHLEGPPDQPEWLSHVNASVLKVKLSTAIIGISSIHLLKTFINAANYDEKVLMWQSIIHIAFLLSALAIADRPPAEPQTTAATRIDPGKHAWLTADHAAPSFYLPALSDRRPCTSGERGLCSRPPGRPA